MRPEGLIKVVVRPHVPASEVFHYAWHDIYIMLFSASLWTAPLLVRPEGLIKVVVQPSAEQKASIASRKPGSTV